MAAAHQELNVVIRSIAIRVASGGSRLVTPGNITPHSMSVSINYAL